MKNKSLKYESLSEEFNVKSNNIKSKKSDKIKKKGKRDRDISKIIHKDHKPIKDLIQILRDPEVRVITKRSAYQKFSHLLSSHIYAEEKSLYFHLKKNPIFRIPGLEGDAEHMIINQLSTEINQIRSDNDRWEAKVKVLADIVGYHLRREEKEILKRVKKNLDLDLRIQIGGEYLRLVNQHQGEQRSSMAKCNLNNNLIQNQTSSYPLPN